MTYIVVRISSRPCTRVVVKDILAHSSMTSTRTILVDSSVFGSPYTRGLNREGHGLDGNEKQMKYIYLRLA